MAAALNQGGNINAEPLDKTSLPSSPKYSEPQQTTSLPSSTSACRQQREEPNTLNGTITDDTYAARGSSVDSDLSHQSSSSTRTLPDTRKHGFLEHERPLETKTNRGASTSRFAMASVITATAPPHFQPHLFESYADGNTRHQSSHPQLSSPLDATKRSPISCNNEEFPPPRSPDSKTTPEALITPIVNPNPMAAKVASSSPSKPVQVAVNENKSNHFQSQRNQTEMISTSSVAGPMPPPLHSEFPVLFYELRESYRAVEPIRTELQKEEGHFQKLAGDLVASARKLRIAIDRKDGWNEKSLSHLSSDEELAACSNALDLHAEQMAKIWRTLEQKEKDLKQKEAEIYELLSRSHPQAGLHLNYLPEDVPPAPLSAHYASDDDLPPLLHEYYESAGDLTIFRERLQEFEFDHSQELRIRDKRRADGLGVELPEREFLENYFRRRKAMIKDISESRVKAQRLRKECLQQGYKPEPVYDVDELAQVMDRSQRIQADRGQHIPSLEVIAASDDLDPFERIIKWAFDVRRRTSTSQTRPAISPLPRKDPGWTPIEREPEGYQTSLSRPRFFMLEDVLHLEDVWRPTVSKEETAHTLRKYNSDPYLRSNALSRIQYSERALSERTVD